MAEPEGRLSPPPVGWVWNIDVLMADGATAVDKGLAAWAFDDALAAGAAKGGSNIRASCAARERPQLGGGARLRCGRRCALSLRQMTLA
jgi:hypothetical protein